jgi:hypothetical protein
MDSHTFALNLLLEPHGQFRVFLQKQSECTGRSAKSTFAYGFEWTHTFIASHPSVANQGAKSEW